MKPTKTYSLTLVFTLMTFGAIFYISCTKKDNDSCKNISCLNGGACYSGNCFCPTGYTGTFCESIVDPCQSVTCRNGGTCNAGNCTCPPGSGGTFCETVYRNNYANTYKGTATDDSGNSYNDHAMVFAITGTDLTKMKLDIVSPYSTTLILSCTITLNSTSAAGTTYTLTPTTTGGYTYTGSGVISASVASLSLRAVGLTTTNYTFASFVKQ